MPLVFMLCSLFRVPRHTELPHVFHAGMRAIFGIGLVSAFISTGDTAVMLVSTSLQNEMRRWNFIKAGDNRNLKRQNSKDETMADREPLYFSRDSYKIL